MRNKGVSRGEIPATTIHHLEYYFCNDFSPSGFLNLFVIDQRKHANCTYTYTLIFHKLASFLSIDVVAFNSILILY